MKAKPSERLTEEAMLPEDEVEADLEAWMPQDFEQFSDFGQARLDAEP